MNEEHIRLLKSKLVDINPLGERAKLVLDLNEYETEAIDILFHINKRDSRERVKRIIISVFEQAFNIDLKENDCAELTQLVMELKKEMQE